MNWYDIVANMKGSKKKASTPEKTVFQGYRLYPSDIEIVKRKTEQLKKKEPDGKISESELVRRAVRAFII